MVISSNAIHRVLVEKGAAYFTENRGMVLRNAGFDFEKDIQLLGVGKRLEEAEKWMEGAALFEVYTKLFPNIVVAWNRLGICRKALGDGAGAKAAWEQSLKLRPGGNPAAQWLKE
jgi:Flp pilus assembly protein TadD